MPQEPDDRVTELEIRITHLSRDFDSLNEVVIEQGRELAALTKGQHNLRKLIEQVIGSLREGAGGRADPSE